jgi:hypothetical protein
LHALATGLTLAISNFSVFDGLSLTQKDLSVKAIFSTPVSHRFDNIDIGLSQFSEFFRVRDFGGTLMVQMLPYQWPRETGKLALVSRACFINICAA